MKNPLGLLIVGVLILFVGWWMFTDPRGLAELSRDGAGEGWDLLVVGFENIRDFVVEIFQ